MTRSHYPPIGALAMRLDGSSTAVFRVVAIRGRTQVTGGVICAPSPMITIERVTTHDRTEMRLADFCASYQWEIVQ